jgi:tetratricopeptide (TPR) repeat protein
LRLEPTPEARHVMEKRAVKVFVDQLPLRMLVRSLAQDADLSWELSDDTLSFATLNQLPEETLVARRLVTARAAVQDSLVTSPTHPLAAVAYLELGNLEVLANRIKEGLGWYERMLRELPRSRIPAELYYNLAVTRHRLGEGPSARDAYYWVIDRSPGSDLALLAYAQIGRGHLEESNPAAAIRPLRRALGEAQGSRTSPAVALLLAAALLMTDAPRPAYSTLAALGPILQDEPYRRPAALLDALARYRCRPSSSQATREAGDVLAALLVYREEPVLGKIGVLLAARAYRDLGLPEEMAILYERVSFDRNSPLGQEMTADLAEYHFQLREWKTARLEFEFLAGRDSRYSQTAQLRLAELDLQEKHPDDCLKRCRRVLSATPKAIPLNLLTLMGRAYNQKGDSDRASRCFAGEVPAP